jgi:uncharacterized membrane protein
MLTFRLLSSTGQPSPNTYTQVVSVNRSHFVVVFSLSGPDAQEVGKRITDKIHHSEVDSPESLMSLIERIREQCQTLYLELGIFYLFHDKTYLICLNGEMWLQRAGKAGRVLKASDELRVVEGQARENDLYICITQSAAVATMSYFPTFQEGTGSAEDHLLNIDPLIPQSGLADRSAISLIEIVGQPDPVVTATDTQSPLPAPTVSPKKIAFNPQKISAGVKKAIQFAKHSSVHLKKGVSKLKTAQTDRALRKKIALVCLILFAIFAVVFGFVLFRNFQISRTNAFIDPFAQRLSATQQLALQDSFTARDQALTLQKEYEEQRKVFGTPLGGQERLDAFGEQITTFVKEISGKVELQTLPNFFNFQLVRSDFLASQVDVDKGVAIFLDQEKQVAISLNLSTKQQTLLPIGQFSVLKDIAFVDDQIYFYADGIYRSPIDSKNEPQKIIEEGDSNRDGKIMGVFGDFAYVLNVEKRNIYRYSLTSEKPEPIGWFQDKKDLEFEQITSMAIDGTIWLGTQTGQILKYERGLPIAFSPQGLQDPLSTSVKVFTKESLDSVFVLEPSKQRVVRLAKTGEFLKEINSPFLAAATEVIFSPETNKGYAIAGSVIYELDL